MPAKAKVTAQKALVDLAKQIKEKHDLISTASDDLDTLKKQLIEKAKINFFKDLKCKVVGDKPTVVLPGIPKVYGNHEVPVGNNDKVTVNFQTGAKVFKQVDDKPAKTVLKGIFHEDFDKIFVLKPYYEVTATDEDLNKHEDQYPELFGYGINPTVTKEKLRELYHKYPDLITRTVINTERYAELFPDKVNTVESVSTGNGFIEKVSKLDDQVLENAKNFLAGLFRDVLKVVIKVGNRNKNSKK